MTEPLDLDQLTRAFMRYIQELRGCNRMQERCGQPCREAVRCGCHIEMLGHYQDAE